MNPAAVGSPAEAAPFELLWEIHNTVAVGSVKGSPAEAAPFQLLW